MDYFYLVSIIIFSFFLNYFVYSKKILLSETGDNHQKFSSKQKIPLTGGILIFLGYLYFINNEILSFILFCFFILLLGIFSDLKLIKSVKLRFFLQVFLVIFYIAFNKLEISGTRIFLLDNFLNITIINILFVTFCILIVINGSNFIDGMNTLSIGYFLLISLIINILYLDFGIDLKDISILYIFYLLFIIFFLNLTNKLYLGDSGSYLLGFSFSIFLIHIYNWNTFLSPFFIVLLLWYPCYENLFSILRKNILKKSPLNPDSNHLHQLIFFVIKKKFKLTVLNSNLITAQLINIYNLIIFLIALNFCTNSQIQVLLILFNMTMYTFIYFKFFVFKYKKFL
tara:strand:- start:335 stop:1357 length:1023 start_codon:yes stop_codon:yes gene_type:complete